MKETNGMRRGRKRVIWFYGQYRLQKSLHFWQRLKIGNLLEMIKHKLLASCIPTCPQAYYKKLQCINRGTGEGTWPANHMNKLFTTEIRKKQRNQKLPTYYVLINHVQNSNWYEYYNQNNFQIFGRAKLTDSRAKMISPWK